VKLRLLSPLDEDSSAARKWVAAVGLGCVVAAVVGGGLKAMGNEVGQIDSPLRQVGLGILGIVLIAASVLADGTRSSSHSESVLSDVDFLRLVLEVMPPTFIKKFPHDEHVYDNQALRTLQGEKPAQEDALQGIITSDHRSGDQRAAQRGASVQLELSDPFETKRPQPILTFKRRVEYGGERYIVGWYLPVEPPKLRQTRQPIELRKFGEQVIFALPEAVGKLDDAYLIHIGESMYRKR
jgi:hypothetical protein